MSDQGMATVAECPLLQPARPLAGSPHVIGIYCRLPDDRVHVPSLEDRRRFCLTGQWQRCPTWRRHAPAS